MWIGPLVNRWLLDVPCGPVSVAVDMAAAKPQRHLSAYYLPFFRSSSIRVECRVSEPSSFSKSVPFFSIGKFFCLFVQNSFVTRLEVGDSHNSVLSMSVILASFKLECPLSDEIYIAKELSLDK